MQEAELDAVIALSTGETALVDTDLAAAVLTCEGFKMNPSLNLVHFVQMALNRVCSTHSQRQISCSVPLGW